MAGPVTATQTGPDAVASVQAAIAEAERLLGRPLMDDLTDPETGQLTPGLRETQPASRRFSAS